MKMIFIQKLIVPVVLICLCFFLLPESQGRGNSERESTNAVFTSSEPISNGFVFVEGRYIDAPYVVSRKGLAIYINDIFIATFAPLVSDILMPDHERPEMPMDITSNSTPNDKAVGTYLLRMQNYLSVRNSRSKLADEMENVVSALPCVKEVRRNSDSISALVTYLNGKTDNMALVSPTRKPVITSANAVEYVSKRCRYYVSRLEEGVFYSFSANGSRIHSFGSSIAKNQVPAIVEVLRSSQDDESKARQLREMLGMSPDATEDARLFVENVCLSKQLDHRAEVLKGRSNIP